MSPDARDDLVPAIELAGITAKLRAARQDQAASQEDLARRLGVRGRAVSDWELNNDLPRLVRLLHWCRILDTRLVLIGPDGQILYPRMERISGEGWAGREARRLATALRGQRLATGRTQQWCADQLGIDVTSFNRLERSRSHPRVFVLARWAARFGCCLTLLPGANAPGPAAKFGDTYTARAGPRQTVKAVTSDPTTTLGLGRLDADPDQTIRERTWQSTDTVSAFT